MGKDCCHPKEEGADFLSAQGVPPGLLPGETAPSLCAALRSMRARLGPCNKAARTGGWKSQIKALAESVPAEDSLPGLQKAASLGPGPGVLERHGLPSSSSYRAANPTAGVPPL